MENATTRAINNNLAIQNAIQQVVADTRRARPKNTSENYDSKQLEWLSWCATKGFADGNLVCEGKLLLYLREVVVPRGSGKRISGVVQPLSADGLEGYVKAIVDHYSTQQSLGLNRDPHPRGKALKGYLHNMKQQRAQRKRIEYLDRGEGTVQDTYSQDELRRIANHFFTKNNGRSLRDRLDVLLGHAIMARGESTRKLQLPDLFMMEILNEGPTPCFAAMTILDHGKTNQEGRIEYGGCVRARDVEVCPVGALALHLFWRFQITNEPFPNLTRRQNWYDIHLLNGRDATKEISYGAQANPMKKAMDACSVMSKKVTHIRRTSSCVIAEANGADDASIRRAGRWNNEKMEKGYLTTLPKPVVRALAGFHPDGGDYYLPRAEVTMPDALLAQVFPALADVEAALGACHTKEIAAQGFLKLMKWLRHVVIQDAVLLRLAHPKHPIWQAALFQTSMFREYASTALVTIQRTQNEPLDRTLKQALPVLANVLQSGLSSVTSRLEAMESSLASMKTDIRAIATGKFTVSFTPSSECTEPASVAESAVVSSKYELSRRLRTVDEVWQEYSVGFSGCPSVKELDDTYQATWRRSESERQYYSKRKVFYDAIKFLAGQLTFPETTVATLLEKRRCDRRMTLDRLMKDLKKRGPSAVFSTAP